ncbi:MAG: hypothetical protein NPIRA04_16710 [Nitrospirales bacterium]|nr:MAG: hypothetical protein NPIRA04_16710 [Nitrospirales bacterium]
MPVVTEQMQYKMQGGTHIENITHPIQETLKISGLQAGTVTVFVKHTTASIMIIEDEPGIRSDTTHLWDQLIPSNPDWLHNTRNPGEDNGHSHLRGQLQGAFVTIPFVNSTLTLGTWQQVVLIDFDTRARTRDVVLQMMGE